MACISVRRGLGMYLCEEGGLVMYLCEEGTWHVSM